MFSGFTGGTCRCTFTVCQCYAQTTGIMQSYVIVTSGYGNFVPDPPPPRKNQPHYSQFNRGAYGTKRKKR